MDINVLAKFDEIPSLPVQDIKENQTIADWRTERQTDVKTVYPPPPNKHIAVGINIIPTHRHTVHLKQFDWLIWKFYTFNKLSRNLRPIFLPLTPNIHNIFG